MDPITNMAQGFMNSWLRFRQSGKFRFFRIDTDPSMHPDLWRLFRAIEMNPDNRSPYLMFSAPFVNRSDFCVAAIRKLGDDYMLLREGLTKNGISIDEWKPSPAGQAEPEEHLVSVVQAFWEKVKSQFEYLMIIILPERIEATADWSATIERLASLLSSPSFRLAAADTQESLLVGLCKRLDKRALEGRFFLASSALQEFLLRVAEGGWPALSSNRPPKSLPPEQQASPLPAAASPEGATGASAGNSLPPDEAARLRTYMANSAIASGQHKTEDAVAQLREARLICKRNGLTAHEAILLMAIANTFLASENGQEALPYYGEAVLTAAQAPAPIVGMQAQIGLASTLFHLQQYDQAAQAYEKAARDAPAAESEVLGIEACRMAGTCHNIQGRVDDAIRCWNEALGSGGRISLAEINASTIDQVGQEFIKLCERTGLTEQAKSVAQQMELIRQQALERDLLQTSAVV